MNRSQPHDLDRASVLMWPAAVAGGLLIWAAIIAAIIAIVKAA